MVRESGAFACWGSRTAEYIDAARWSAANLPDGAVVMSRKPSIFYVMSGISSQIFPFTTDGDAFLAGADSAGASYVIMDYMDATASRYVAAALYDAGGAFCLVGQFSADNDDLPTQLLGILPPDRRREADVEAADDGTVTVAMLRCPTDMIRAEPRTLPPPSDPGIPLLTWNQSSSSSSSSLESAPRLP
jgi:hypothetical protein